MAKSKHRFRKGKKSKRSSLKDANAKLALKKSETTKPRNKATTALFSAAVFIKSKALESVAAVKAAAKCAKEKGRKAAVPVKAAVIAVKAKTLNAVASVKVVVAAVNANRLKTIAAVKAVSACMKTKWFPIVGVTFWNYIIAPVLAVVIVIRSRPRYMAAALLLLALPAVVITTIAVSFPSAESGAVPVILAADNADDNEASDSTKSAEVNAAV